MVAEGWGLLIQRFVHCDVCADMSLLSLVHPYVHPWKQVGPLSPANRQKFPVQRVELDCSWRQAADRWLYYLAPHPTVSLLKKETEIPFLSTANHGTGLLVANYDDAYLSTVYMTPYLINYKSLPKFFL